LVGSSSVSTPSNAVTPATVPSSPRNVVTVPGNAQATVSWIAPVSNGGSAITLYIVTSNPGGITAATSATTTTVTGLTNETSYTFKVTATNSVGTSSASAASNAVTPFVPTVPDAPTNVTAAGGNSQASVTWTEPDSNGFPISLFTVISSPEGLVATTTSSTNAYFTGLANGTAYTFTVTATNSLGESSSSVASNAVVPGAPGKPWNVNAVGGNGKATVSWGDAATNGFTIDFYTVTSSPGGITSTTSATTTVLTGLTNGSFYTFHVTASNLFGTGPASLPSTAIAPGIPSAPTNPHAVRGNGRATVNWNAPQSSGGFVIDFYTVTSIPDAVSVSTNSTSAEVEGLVNGTSYRFTITATNSVGTSASSTESNTVTPATIPDAPANVNAMGGDAQAVVSWSIPETDGGSAIFLYTVTSDPGGITATTSANTATTTATSTTITGLTNGTVYTFTVVATNAIGTGIASIASNEVTPSLSVSRVSVSSSGDEGNKNSFLSEISTDGRYVVFSSEATNLVAGDTNAYEDIFLHDPITGVTERVSVSTAGIVLCPPQTSPVESWIPDSQEGRQKCQEKVIARRRS
jgi:hypothetical protein